MYKEIKKKINKLEYFQEMEKQKEILHSLNSLMESNTTQGLADSLNNLNQYVIAIDTDRQAVEDGLNNRLLAQENAILSSIPANCYIVAKQGGDFNDIQSAVNASSDGTTILIYPGTYIGTVNVVGKKLSLIGLSKYNTIIQTNTGDYYNPPLETAGGCYFENLFFNATSLTPNSHSINSYGVHMDFAGAGTTEFKNCRIHSHQNSAFGVGLQDNQTLIISDCEIIKFSDGAVYNSGGFYIHNSPFSNHQNQYLQMNNNMVYADQGYSLRIDDARMNAGGIDVNTIFEFNNNQFYSGNLGINSYNFTNPPTNGGFAGRIKLSEKSFGNNIDIINNLKTLNNVNDQTFDGVKKFNQGLIIRGFDMPNNGSGSYDFSFYNDITTTGDFKFQKSGNTIFEVSPNDVFKLTNAQARDILVINSNITLGNHRYVIIPLSSAFTVTLPSASLYPNVIYSITNKSSATKTIGSYISLTGATVTTIPASSTITVLSTNSVWERVL